MHSLSIKELLEQISLTGKSPNSWHTDTAQHIFKQFTSKKYLSIYLFIYMYVSITSTLTTPIDHSVRSTSQYSKSIKAHRLERKKPNCP